MNFTEMKAVAEQAISKSLMQLMRSKDQAYITCVLLNLPKEITEEIPTAGVNGVRMVINPKFFLELSEAQRRFLLVHEAWHIGLMDVIRGKNKDKQVWNQACDHYINLMVDGQKDAQLSFIEGGLKNPKYTGWEKEDIYNDLLKNPPSNCNNPLDNDIQDGDGELSEEEVQKIEGEISKIVQQAAMQAKAAGGRVPTQVETYLDDLYNPRLPWDKILIKYMDSFNNEDYSYQRINKNFFPHGIILPTLYGEGLGRIAIANDTSSSVNDIEFKSYLGAIADIKTKLNPSQMDVVSFTTRIEKTWTIQSDEDISKIQFRAQGGTDLYPVFDHFNDPKNQPQVLIVFSDLECMPIRKKPNFDVIWIVVNNPNAKVNFGKKIHLEVKQ